MLFANCFSLLNILIWCNLYSLKNSMRDLVLFAQRWYMQKQYLSAVTHALVIPRCNKTCDGSNSRKEELVLVPGSIRYLTHYDVRSLMQLITLHGSQGGREQTGSRARLLNLKVHLQWHTSSSKFCPLKILQPPKASPPKPAGDWAFKHLGPWRTLHSQTPDLVCQDCYDQDKEYFYLDSSTVPSFLCGGHFFIPLKITLTSFNFKNELSIFDSGSDHHRWLQYVCPHSLPTLTHYLRLFSFSATQEAGLWGPHYSGYLVLWLPTGLNSIDTSPRRREREGGRRGIFDNLFSCVFP